MEACACGALPFSVSVVAFLCQSSVSGCVLCQSLVVCCVSVCVCVCVCGVCVPWGGARDGHQLGQHAAAAACRHVTQSWYPRVRPAHACVRCSHVCTRAAVRASVARARFRVRVGVRLCLCLLVSCVGGGIPTSQLASTHAHVLVLSLASVSKETEDKLQSKQTGGAPFRRRFAWPMLPGTAGASGSILMPHQGTARNPISAFRVRIRVLLLRSRSS